jgi:hypothetical protein
VHAPHDKTKSVEVHERARCDLTQHTIDPLPINVLPQARLQQFTTGLSIPQQPLVTTFEKRGKSISRGISRDLTPAMI